MEKELEEKLEEELELVEEKLELEENKNVERKKVRK